MTSRKVKFHTLERLDIVDMDALQDLAHLALQDAVGAILGARQGNAAGNALQGGLLQDFSFSTNNVTNTLTPTDFVFVASRGDADIANLNRMVVGSYNGGAGGNSVVNFSVGKAAAQAYYNANGNTLPPTPGSAAYVAGTHGASYPKIYARVYSSEGALDTRRFWDVANAVEESRSVNTRKNSVVAFVAYADGVSPPAIAAGTDSSDWVLIGQISGWSLSGGTVNVPSSLIKHFYADFLMPLDASDPYLKISSHDELAVNLIATVRGGGIPAVMDLLKGRVNSMKNSGSLDSDIPATYNVDTGTLAYPPRYSLDGLAGATRTLRAMHRRVSAAVSRNAFSTGAQKISLISDTIQHTVSEGSVVTAVNGSAPAGTGEFFVPIKVHHDLTMYKEMNYTLNAGNIGYVSANTQHALSAWCSGFFVEIPSEYAGWGMRVSLTQLNRKAVYADYTSRLCMPMLYISNDGDASEHRKVQQLTYVDSADVAHTAYGFRVSGYNCMPRPQDTLALNGFLPSSIFTTHVSAYGCEFGFELSLDLFPVDEFTIVDTPN